jgi:hypothetical protein
MSTDLFPEVTDDELVRFFKETLKEVPLRTMAQIRRDTGRQTDTVEIPVQVRRGPRHLKPYRGPRFWRNPVQWVNWNFGYWIYWGLNEQNRYGSHRVV